MLRSFDFLGPSVVLKINNENFLKSKIGGLSTITMLFLSICAFFGFGMDLFYKQNPSVIFNRMNNNEEDDVSYNFTDSNFLFSLNDQMTDQTYEELDRKFIGYFDLLEFFGDGTSSRKKYYFEKCTESALKNSEGYFKNNKESYYCLSKGTFVEIKGYLNRGILSSSLRLQYEFCKNNTDIKQGPLKSNCYDRKFIEKNFTGNIQMHYLTKSINVNTMEYEKPAEYVSFTGVVDTNINTWSRLRIALKKIEIETDIGFFTEDIKNDIYYGVDSVTKESIYSIGTDTIFSHLITIMKYKDVYQRKYIKVQNIFALMGGFINAASILIKIFLKFITEPDIIDIFNKIHLFKEVNEKSSNKNKTGHKIVLINDLTSSDTRFNNKILKNKNLCDSTNLGPEALIQSWNINKNKNYKFKLTFLQKFFCPCRSLRIDNHKQEIYEQIKKKMSKVVSFENFVKISRDTKILNYLFLDNFKKILEVCPIPKKSKKKDQIHPNFEQLFIDKDNDDKIFIKIVGFLNQNEV